MNKTVRIYLMPANTERRLWQGVMLILFFAFLLIGAGRYAFGGSVIFELFAVFMVCMVFMGMKGRKLPTENFVGDALEAVRWLEPMAYSQMARRRQANDDGPAR